MSIRSFARAANATGCALILLACTPAVNAAAAPAQPAGQPADELTGAAPPPAPAQAPAPAPQTADAPAVEAAGRVWVWGLIGLGIVIAGIVYALVRGRRPPG